MTVTQNKRVCLTCGSKFDDTVETCPQDGSALKALANDPLVGKVFAGKYEILVRFTAHGTCCCVSCVR
jgi:hypothetical protein